MNKELALKEALRLQEVYKKQGNTDCYCDTSIKECPAHMELYIESLKYQPKGDKE